MSAVIPWSAPCIQGVYCRFHITFQSAVPKFVVNLPITFPNSEVGRELRNFASSFESSNFDCKQI
jgi:hypothetical protein